MHALSLRHLFTKAELAVTVGTPREDLSEIRRITSRHISSYSRVSLLCAFKLVLALRHIYLSQRTSNSIVCRPISHMCSLRIALVIEISLFEVYWSFCLISKMLVVIVLLLLAGESLKLVGLGHVI